LPTATTIASGGNLSDKINFVNGWREFQFGSGRDSSLSERAEAMLHHYLDAKISIEVGDLGQYSINTVSLDDTRSNIEVGYVPQYTPKKAIQHFATLMSFGPVSSVVAGANPSATASTQPSTA
jgi:hypothetical protein